MARKKRLDRAAVLNTAENSILYTQENENADKKVYRTAVYVRLSVEDNGKTGGESVENQLTLLTRYVENRADLVLYRVYVDNGRTGTTFDRVAFRNMERDMIDGKIDCIITKDLSRLGRDYLEVGDYLERVFNEHHIRYISVNDDYDSLYDPSLEISLIIPLKNLMNEAYAKDISKKVTTAFQARQKQGKFLGNYPPFGYLKDPMDKNRLIVDEATRQYVQMIFRWKIDGMTNGLIARKLNDMSVPHPYKYLYEKGLMKSDAYKDAVWNRTLVKRLLKKEVYMGDMVCGKERSDLNIGINRHRTQSTEWIIVRDTHEPIISREDFAKAQDRIQKDKDFADSLEQAHISVPYPSVKEQNIYRGMIRCGVCGNALKVFRYVKTIDKQKAYRAAGYQCVRNAELADNCCKGIRISMYELNDAVESVIQENIRWFSDQQKIIQEYDSEHFFSTIKAELTQKRKGLDKVRGQSIFLYEKYKSGLLKYEEYIRKAGQCANEESLLLVEIAGLESKRTDMEKKLDETMRFMQIIEKHEGFLALNRETLEAFVEKIILYDDKRIEIYFRFRDEFQGLLQEIERRGGDLND